MACRSPPLISKGAQSLPRREVILAPIIESGLMIRCIGLFWMDASPFKVEVKGQPDRIPLISLVVVPLLPTSKMFLGSVRPCKPFPWLTTCPIQKAGQFGRAIGNGAEHDTAVGYGFITGNVDLTFDMICFFDFHFLTSDSLGFVNRVMLAENKFCCIHGSLIV